MGIPFSWPVSVWTASITCEEMMKRAVFARELAVLIVMHDYLSVGFTANIWDPIHLFGLILNREIGLIAYLLDRIYI